MIFKITAVFHDKNQPSVTRQLDAPFKEDNKQAYKEYTPILTGHVCELARTYAGVAFISVFEGSQGPKHIFDYAGDYQYTISKQACISLHQTE